ncbi:MAG TPA: hypothetical protein VF297_04165 [Pyrinomonadaceae bacterium]
MSTTLDEVLREARKLAPDERRELAERLLEESPRSATDGGKTHGQKDDGLSADVRRQRLEWLKSHRAEYGGQHVALDGAALVAVGQSYREAKEKALSAGKPGAFVTYLPKPDEVAEWGGW